MPLQAVMVLSLLHVVGVKSNSIVSGWSDDDWADSIFFIGVDFVVEIVVFVGSILVLKRIYPEFDAGRILRGLLRMHWVRHPSGVGNPGKGQNSGKLP